MNKFAKIFFKLIYWLLAIEDNKSMIHMENYTLQFKFKFKFKMQKAEIMILQYL